MKTILLTAATDSYWPVMQLTAPNRLEYCRRHGLEFWMRRHSDEYTSGEREYFILDALDHCDWLWFQGADVIITNMGIDFRQFTGSLADLVCCKDRFGFNNDVLLMRSCPAVKRWLRRSIFHCHTEGNDQKAMTRWMDGLKVCWVPQKAWQCYDYARFYPTPGWTDGQWEKGDFVLHLPGMGNDTRLAALPGYLAQVV